MNKRIIVHIGLPKTATTFLQTHVFPLMGDTHRVGRGGDPNSPMYFIYDDFMLMRKQNVSITEEKIHRANMAINCIKESTILITYEGFSGSAIVDTDKDAFLYYCEYIRHVLPPAIVLLFIRRQDSILESFYSQRIKKGYFKSFNSFIGFRNGQFGKERSVPFDAKKMGIKRHSITDNNTIKMSVYDLDYFNIVKVLSSYKNIVQIKIFCQEELKEDSGRLCDFLGVSEFPMIGNPKTNISYSLITALGARSLNCIHIFLFRFLMSIFKNDQFLTKVHRRIISWQMRLCDSLDRFLIKIHLYQKPKYINEKMKSRIMDIHASSNQMLSSGYKLTLKKYGYF